MLAGVAGVAGVPLGSRRKKNTDLRMFWSFTNICAVKKRKLIRQTFKQVVVLNFCLKVSA